MDERLGQLLHNMHDASSDTARTRARKAVVLYAAEIGDLAVLRELFLEEKVSLRSRNSTGEGLIVIAAKNGHAECVKFLLQQKSFFFSLCNGHGELVLKAVIEKGYVECLSWLLWHKKQKKFLEEFCVEYVKSEWNFSLSPLWQAINQDIRNRSEDLLQKEFELNGNSLDIDYCAHFAVVQKMSSVDDYQQLTQMYKEMLEGISAVFGKDGLNDFYIKSPHIHCVISEEAGKKGNISYIEMLVERGVNIHGASSRDHNSILAAAVHAEKVECAKWLIKTQCFSVDEINCRGRSILSISSEIRAEELVSFLLDNGASYTRGGPLAAAELGHVECGKLYLDRGRKVDFLSDLGVTPLIQAVLSGHLERAQLLINRGADVTMLSANRQSALVLAAQYLVEKEPTKSQQDQYILLIQNLLEHGADASTIIVSPHGVLPLLEYMIFRDMDPRFVHLLLSHGADADSGLFCAALHGRDKYVYSLIAHGANHEKLFSKPEGETATALVHAASKGHFEFMKSLVCHVGYVDSACEAGLSRVEVSPNIHRFFSAFKCSEGWISQLSDNADFMKKFPGIVKSAGVVKALYARRLFALEFLEKLNTQKIFMDAVVEAFHFIAKYEQKMDFEEIEFLAKYQLLLVPDDSEFDWLEVKTDRQILQEQFSDSKIYYMGSAKIVVNLVHKFAHAIPDLPRMVHVPLKDIKAFIKNIPIKEDGSLAYCLNHSSQGTCPASGEKRLAEVIEIEEDEPGAKKLKTEGLSVSESSEGGPSAGLVPTIDPIELEQSVEVVGDSSLEGVL